MSTLVIAEAGVNHNGSLEKAKKMISVAKKAGANYIKFQAYKTEYLVSKKAKKAKYQINKKNKTETQFKMLKKFEFSPADFKLLFKFCKNKKIGFMLSVFDTKSLKIIKDLKLNIIKVPSGEITNYELLEEISKFKKKVILSTGMASLSEIKNAIKILTSKKIKKKNITILQCTSAYPTKLSDVNLSALNYLKKKLRLKVGFSDHTIGTLSSVSAVALGASVIEKHFTLNRKLKGPDHKSSLDPQNLKNFVENIRKVEVLMGKPIKKITNIEKQNLKYVRKSLMAVKNIKKGEIIKKDLIRSLRPGTGIPANNFFKILGTRSKKNYLKGDFL